MTKKIKKVEFTPLAKKPTKRPPKPKTPKTQITMEKVCSNCGSIIERTYNVPYESLAIDEQKTIESWRYCQTIIRHEEHADYKGCIQHLRGLIEGLSFNLNGHVNSEDRYSFRY